MALRLLGHIELPAHRSTGGFDHADIHLPTNRIYVAHTSNDSVDVIDCGRDRYIESIPDLMGVAGALVSETRGLVFTSNRGENTVSVFAPCDEQNAFKIAVGVKPNGLAFDPTRNILIAANVGDASIPDSCSVSVVDVERRERIAEVKVPGRTRWAIYDAALEMFFVNIASPPRIAAIDARDPIKISTEYEVPAAGPHGLDFDPAKGRLLCACDVGALFAIDAASGRVLGDVSLSGAPDVIFLHPQSGRLYVAIGDPGLIDVIDIGTMRCEKVVPTEAGAHTLALDRKRSKIYSFLPQSHRAAVFVDTT
jgi:DNA-binding beta-propeller fold protein YncE